MTSHALPTLAFGALVALVLAVDAPAQTAPASPILNTVEVRKLVSSGDSADHARLVGHYSALAERYAADAKRHTAMAQAFIGSPSRRTAANSAADHCKRLAQLHNESAKMVRELAAHHQKLASGTASTAPKGGAKFESGAGAPLPSEADLAALAAKASTPDNHRALEEYFLSAAKRYGAEANEHAAMAQAYRGTRIAQAAAHCDRLAQLSRDAAKEANEAASIHKGPASVSR